MLLAAGLPSPVRTGCHAAPRTPDVAIAPPLPLQESALNAFLGNLSEALLLPEGSITLDSLQETAPSTSDLAISEAQSKERSLRLARLLLAEPKPQQQGKPAAAAGNVTQGEEAEAAAAAAKQQGGPMYLIATVSLSPEAAAESGGQFSAAWMSAALGQVVAEQPADSPVQLGTNNQVTRCARVGSASLCSCSWSSLRLSVVTGVTGAQPCASSKVFALPTDNLPSCRCAQGCCVRQRHLRGRGAHSGGIGGRHLCPGLLL